MNETIKNLKVDKESENDQIMTKIIWVGKEQIVELLETIRKKILFILESAVLYKIRIIAPI